MTSAFGRRSAIALALCLVAAGCQKQDDGTAKESVRLLQEIKSAVSVTHRPGEAFLVLKSDAVIYMADMEVLYFRADLKEKLAAFHAKWSAAQKTQLDDIIAKDPDIQSRLKKIGDERNELLKKKESLNQEAAVVVVEAINRLTPELQELRAEQQATEAAHADYQKIVEPFDRAIAKANQSIHAIAEDEEAMAAALRINVNETIVAAKWAVPKLPEMSPKQLFAASEGTRNPSIPLPKGLVLHSEPIPGTTNWQKLLFADNIPAEIAGTPCEALVRSAFPRWAKMEMAREATENEIGRQVAAKDLALVAWSNRTNIPAWHIPVFLQQRISRQSDIDARAHQLASLESGGPEAKALIEAEVARRTILLDAGISGLANQRTNLIDMATKDAGIEMKRIFRARFTEMLVREAAGLVRTGSRGDFSVPADSAYLFAERHRQNGESLIWLARIDQKSPQIRLSNSNTTAAGENVDEFWMLSATID